MKKILTLFCLVTLTILQLTQMTGCGAPAPHNEVELVEEREPIKINENFGLFAFSKLTIRTSPDSTIKDYIIGFHFEKPTFGSYKNEFTYESSDIFLLQDSLKSEKLFQEVVNSELNKAGYKIVASSNSLFEQTENQSARFLIHATMLDLKKDTYHKKHQSVIYAQYEINVKWEIYDQQEKKVIFSKMEIGNIYEDLNLLQLKNNVYDFEFCSWCIKISFDNLLANREFVNSIKLQVKNFPSK